LTVTDDEGTVNTDFVFLTVTDNDDPTARISVDRTTIEAGETVTFDDSGSSDPDGSIVSYEWAFGTGTGDAGQQVSHTYETPGEYNATLLVTDDENATDATTVSITVREENASLADASANRTDTGTVTVGNADD